MRHDGTVTAREPWPRAAPTRHDVVDRVPRVLVAVEELDPSLRGSC